ncbi:hypothetical protein LSAT2_007422 [Lamellibrachia satsuma]|nr:hypothetical protein LSAT2_007422 [Lamellibrachia satsuma]
MFTKRNRGSGKMDPHKARGTAHRKEKLVIGMTFRLSSLKTLAVATSVRRTRIELGHASAVAVGTVNGTGRLCVKNE